MMFLGAIILCCFLATFVESSDWPIIAIFAQPSSKTDGNCGGNCQYLAASYVKYIESAGARVVPVDYYATTAELDELFNNVNGFFFPGGGSSYPSTAQYIFDKIVAANDAGDYMPLWGTCMGFQWLLISAARSTSILDPPSGVMDSYNYSIPLDFTSEATSSRLFSSAPAEVMNILGKENVTMNNHHYGIFPTHFNEIDSLKSFYNVLSTNKDRAGVEFVSTMEAYKYPIYGSQWHPEKNPYEWGKDDNNIPNEAINHSFDAILIAQYAANFFVNEARKNNHFYSNGDLENQSLINNYPVTKTTGDFMETYFFNFFNES